MNSMHLIKVHTRSLLRIIIIVMGKEDDSGGGGGGGGGEESGAQQSTALPLKLRQQLLDFPSQISDTFGASRTNVVVFLSIKTLRGCNTFCYFFHFQHWQNRP